MRAPSTLPFALQPNPTPQQIRYQQQLAQLNNKQYISAICRNGPVTISRHTLTDPICLVLYILLLISTLVLFFINYFSQKVISQVSFQQLNILQKLSFSLEKTIPQTILSALCIIVAGLIIYSLIVFIPILAGYILIMLFLLLLGFIIYSLFAFSWKSAWSSIDHHSSNEHLSQGFRISFIVITCLAVLLTLILIFRRIKKLRHLGHLTKVSSIIISRSPFLPLVMIFGLSIIDIGLWCGFTKLVWNCVKFNLSANMPIPPVLLIIMALVFWLWTHGLMLSIADYICESWVIHWYFNANSQNNVNQNTRVKENWKLLVFKKLFRYHLGTCLYGVSVSAFLSQIFIRLIRKAIKDKQKSHAFLQRIAYLSRYCYIQTVLQAYNFCDANKQMYFLRQRIKEKIPELYMLGHFFQQTLKFFLPLGALYLWFFLRFSTNQFFSSVRIVQFSPILFFLFSLVAIVVIFLEVSTNISHLFGLVSDTAVIAYSIDCQIQRVHYHQNLPRSIPPQLKAAFQQLQLDISVQSKYAKDEKNLLAEQTFQNNNILSSNVQPYYQSNSQNPYPTIS